MRRSTPLLRYHTPIPAARGSFLPRPRWRRLRRMGSRLLTLVLVVCVASVSTLSPANAGQPEAPDSIPATITIEPQPQIAIVPQITDEGSLQVTLTPWNLQPLQAAPAPTATVAGCTSPDYIIQGCALASEPGNIRPDAEAAVRRLEDRAVATVLQQYGLSDSERPRVLRYARNEVRAALMDQIETAFETQRSQRSPEQQLVVDAYTRLVREKHAQALRVALNEYRRWNADPCSYVAPAGFSYNRPTACAGGFVQLLGAPESPGLQAFVAYGVAAAYTGTAEASTAGYRAPSAADPAASDIFRASSRAAMLGYSTAGGLILGTSIGVVATSAKLLSIAWIAPFAARAAGSSASLIAGGTAAAVGGAVGVIVFAVTTAITVGMAVAREAEIPTTLQALVDNAGSYDLEYILQTCVSGCVSATSTDLRSDAERELFAGFVLTTLPDYPGTDAAPAPQPGDPQLVVAGSPVDWVQYTADDGSQRAFRLSSDGWFADRAGSTGTGVLALSIKFKDADGATWTARRVGNQFLAVRTDIAPTRLDYPAPQQSADLSVVNWSGATVTARVSG